MCHLSARSFISLLLSHLFKCLKAFLLHFLFLFIHHWPSKKNQRSDAKSTHTHLQQSKLNRVEKAGISFSTRSKKGYFRDFSSQSHSLWAASCCVNHVTTLFSPLLGKLREVWGPPGCSLNLTFRHWTRKSKQAATNYKQVVVATQVSSTFISNSESRQNFTPDGYKNITSVLTIIVCFFLSFFVCLLFAIRASLPPLLLLLAKIHYLIQPKRK